MKEKNKILIAIIAVILIIAAVVGATYAYWTWQTSAADQTNVAFTVPSGEAQLKATLNGATLSVSKLAPTTCTNTKYAAKAVPVLTYTNNTGVNANAYGTLTVTNFTKPHGATSGTITPTAADLGNLKYALTTSSTSCTTGVIASGDFSALYNKTSAALFSDKLLQGNITSGTTNATKTMYLYVWLDKDYEYTNTGSKTVTDPMQDLSFTLTWTGSITNAQ